MIKFDTLEKLVACKNGLARLLAQENLTVVHDPHVPTASMDLKNRILTCPVWKDMTPYLYDFLMSHEVGHALETPSEEWDNEIRDNRNRPNWRHFLNIIEDIRIERLMRLKFPGLKYSYISANEYLLENFYKEGSSNPDVVNTMPLIDRLSLYFRYADETAIKFDTEESEFLARAQVLRTWDDVVSLTNDVYEYQNENGSSGFDDVNNAADNVAGKSDNVADKSRQEQDSDNSDGDSGESGDDTNSEMSDEQNSDSDNSNETDDSDGDSGESGDDDSNADSAKNENGTPKSALYEVINGAIESLVISNNSRQDEIPQISIPDSSYSIFENSHVKTYDYLSRHVESKKNSFLGKSKKNLPYVNYMVKEFMMKQSADEHARTMISKTGVIDSNKLHSYQHNDDIFKRNTYVKEGKSHGIMIYIDWSGSMCDLTNAVMNQVMMIAEFCYKMNIPLVAYAFQDTLGGNGAKKNMNLKPTDVYFDNMYLLEVYDSTKNRKTSDRMKAMRLLNSMKSELQYENDFIMGGTPLGEAVATIPITYREFKRKNDIDILNVVFLTDGGGNSSRTKEGLFTNTEHQNMIITDSKTKISQAYESGRGDVFILDFIKNSYDINITNFFFTSDSHLEGSTIKNQIDYVFGSGEYKEVGNFNMDYDQNGIAAIKPSVGFDEIFAINIKSVGNPSNKKSYLKILSRLIENIA